MSHLKYPKYPKHLKREVSAFKVMHRRCLEPKFRDFARYGGAGIKICPQWLRNWPQFLADMGPAPSPTHWLGRRIVTLGYSPENVIWTTATEQQRRRAWCHKVTLIAAIVGRGFDEPFGSQVEQRPSEGLLRATGTPSYVCVAQPQIRTGLEHFQYGMRRAAGADHARRPRVVSLGR